MEPSHPHDETAQANHEVASESSQANHEVASESSGGSTSEGHSSYREGVGHREGRQRRRYMELFGDEHVPSQAWELLVCRLDALFVPGVRSIRTCDPD